MSANETNDTWQAALRDVINDGHHAAPRGLTCRELLAGQYRVQLPAFIDLAQRRVNLPFMLAEAAWILSGSNRLSEVTPYMGAYARFSDDGTFMRGAYGPPVVDQLPWVADALVSDPDTRQAVLTTWRERPAPSKDIPCTLALQFLIRHDQLHCVATMRSQDLVLGFTYDVFTFSMITEAVRRLVQPRRAADKTPLQLGHLIVTAGSLHVYETDLDKVNAAYLNGQLVSRDGRVSDAVTAALAWSGSSYEDLIGGLWINASRALVERNERIR